MLNGIIMIPSAIVMVNELLKRRIISKLNILSFIGTIPLGGRVNFSNIMFFDSLKCCNTLCHALDVVFYRSFDFDFLKEQKEK